MEHPPLMAANGSLGDDVVAAPTVIQVDDDAQVAVPALNQRPAANDDDDDDDSNSSDGGSTADGATVVLESSGNPFFEDGFVNVSEHGELVMDVEPLAQALVILTSDRPVDSEARRRARRGAMCRIALKLREAQTTGPPLPRSIKTVLKQLTASPAPLLELLKKDVADADNHRDTLIMLQLIQSLADLAEDSGAMLVRNAPGLLPALLSLCTADVPSTPVSPDRQTPTQEITPEQFSQLQARRSQNVTTTESEERHEQLQYAVCDLLAVFTNSGRVRHLYAADAIPVMVELCKLPSHRVAYSALMVLSNFALDPTYQRQLLDEDAVSWLVPLMFSTDIRVRYDTLVLIAHISLAATDQALVNKLVASGALIAGARFLREIKDDFVDNFCDLYRFHSEDVATYVRLLSSQHTVVQATGAMNIALVAHSTSPEQNELVSTPTVIATLCTLMGTTTTEEVYHFARTAILPCLGDEDNISLPPPPETREDRARSRSRRNSDSNINITAGADVPTQHQDQEKEKDTELLPPPGSTPSLGVRRGGVSALGPAGIKPPLRGAATRGGSSQTASSRSSVVSAIVEATAQPQQKQYSERAVATWTEEDVQQWVQTRRFAQYATQFAESWVDGYILQRLDNQLLQDMGIANGVHRLVILRDIAQLSKRQVEQLSDGGSSPAAEPMSTSPILMRSISDFSSSLSLNPSAGYDVFISYRREGGMFLAQLLKVYLQRANYNVFLDVDGLSNGDFEQDLLQCLKASKNIVLVLTKGALDRCLVQSPTSNQDWIRKEVATALEHKKNLVPVLAKEFMFPNPEQLPSDMRGVVRRNGVEWSHAYQDASFAKLEKFLRRNAFCR